MKRRQRPKTRAAERKQYTIRGVPGGVDRALRERARVEGRSLNTILIEVLERDVAGGDRSPPRRDLSDVASRPLDERAFAVTRAAHERIDPELWR